jgi:hypothetical protein
MAMATQVPEEVLADRREFFTFMDFSILAGEVPHLSTQLRANAALIEEQLAMGLTSWRAMRLGGHHQLLPVWMARAFVPAAEGRSPPMHARMGGAHAPSAR